MSPDVRVVRGAPDDDELAALVAGLAAGGQPGAADSGADVVAARTVHEAAARRRWRDHAAPHPGPPRPGPDAWRWSLRG
ncbi:acyl-CoA carboxylase subunit epsilon [Actinotalea sp. BY-33]|uniref:Acyl-CoA carboxylase subunit epsilon n=1 Tax=Actinotalea soli TaxID=2819234 RepID=A0A939LQ06_9CELL|nr:acyl-CoA carboxylase epsilon subunit [Actinotalea soli]MBO1751859.1 acyl-CoA carboxylase subunit epsilon [Actinotalea soli]